MIERDEDGSEEMAAYIIVSPDKKEQERIAEKFFSFFLTKCGYQIRQSDTFDGKPIIQTENSNGLTVIFCLDIGAGIINMQYKIPLLYCVSAHNRKLADAIIDLCWETRRVNILLDRETREIVLMTAIDISNLSFEAIADVIENRWQEMVEISNSAMIAEFAEKNSLQEKMRRQ